jgi:pyruvoyl-dependent arginine decarboxylase (PvlArgDC)
MVITRTTAREHREHRAYISTGMVYRGMKRGWFSKAEAVCLLKARAHMAQQLAESVVSMWLRESPLRFERIKEEVMPLDS